jgi:hypothetical protein
MAQPPPIAPNDYRDLKDGFVVSGKQIKAAILEKISQRLDKQVADILVRVDGLIPDKRAALSYLAAFTVETNPDNLSPVAAEIYQLCRHLQTLTDEVAELQQIARNIYDTEPYRLGIVELNKYGL